MLSTTSRRARGPLRCGYHSGLLRKREDLLSQSNSIQILYSAKDNIHFNLAVEEYLYETAELTRPTLFLWRNDKAVVIGRH